MLWRLLVLFGLVLTAAGGASWLAQQPGDMHIDWLGWRAQLPTSLAVALVVVFAFLLVFFDRILRAILTSGLAWRSVPAATGRGRTSGFNPWPDGGFGGRAGGGAQAGNPRPAAS